MNAYIYQADLHCEKCAERIMHDLVAEALTKAGAKDASRDLIFYEGAYHISLMPDESVAVDSFMIPSGKKDPKLLPCDGWDFSTDTDTDIGMVRLTLQPPDDENLYDSDDWPKGPTSEGGGESDSPQNCGSGEHCLQAQEGGVYSAGVAKGQPFKYGIFLENPLTTDGYRCVKEMLDEAGETLTPSQQDYADYYSFSYRKNEFESAHDWLDKRLMDLTTRMQGVGTEVNSMLQMAKEMAYKLDGDQIQDLFQSDMDEDGFFEEAGWHSDEMVED